MKSKLPEGRKPLPKEWFIDRAKAITSPENKDKEEDKKKDDWDNWTDGDIV